MTRINRYATVALAVILLAGCDKPEPAKMGPARSSQPVEFSAGTPTKGAPQLSTLERLAAQDFSVSACYTPAGETFGAGSLRYIDNHRFGTLDEGPVYTTWRGITRIGGKAADPAYYPLDGTLSFFCYAPYREDISSASDVYLDYEPDPAVTSRLTNYLEGSPLITFTPSTNTATQIDFLIADPLLDVERGAGVIPLDFSRHLLTNLQFWCKYSGTMDAAEGVMISRLAISDAIGSEYLYFTRAGDGTLGHDRCSFISPVDGSADMPLASYEMASECLIFENPYLSGTEFKHINNTINGNVYMLPQTLPATAQLEVTYQVKNLSTGSVLDENTLVFPLAGTADWPMGKTVRYDITINVATRKDLTITTSIIDWVSAGNTHPSQELMY